MTCWGFKFKSYDLKQQIIKVAVQVKCLRLVEFSTPLFYITFNIKIYVYIPSRSATVGGMPWQGTLQIAFISGKSCSPGWCSGAKKNKFSVPPKCFG